MKCISPRHKLELDIYNITFSDLKTLPSPIIKFGKEYKNTFPRLLRLIPIHVHLYLSAI